jgi:NADPH:quinone reductase-like Zn-dependent oxidoreductase
VTAVDKAGKLSMLRRLGADEVLDCTREDFTRRGVQYDFIFDVPGNNSISECRRALKSDGRYVLIGHEGFGASGKPLTGLFPLFIKLIFLSLFVKQLRLGRSAIRDRQHAMAMLRELLEAGKITPIIDSAYPLSETREAFRHMIEDETRGKVIITAAG